MNYFPLCAVLGDNIRMLKTVMEQVFKMRYARKKESEVNLLYPTHNIIGN